MSDKFQAKPEKTVYFNKEAFKENNYTSIRWLGHYGMFLNSRGTTIMVDPVIVGYDLPLLIEMPVECKDIDKLDAILITHSDNDHLSKETLEETKDVTNSYHGPHYVSEVIKELGYDNSYGSDIYESFNINNVNVKLTPADHAWQNSSSKYNRVFKQEDFCGFYFNTPDGSIWVPGDSRLMEEQLNFEEPDVILFDFSDNPWHIGFENAIRLANNYPNSILIPAHWGTVDALDRNVFNGDPKDLFDRVTNPERIKVLNPGEEFILKKE